jgi:uncharacterized coiled-coil protein SlyX
LDADDFFDERLVEKLLQRIVETEADIAVCESRVYDVATEKYIQNHTINKDVVTAGTILGAGDAFSCRTLPNDIYDLVQTAPWNKLYRRSFLESKDVRFQESMRANDVYFFLLTMAEAEKIAAVHESLVSYCKGIETSLQATNTETPMDFYNALLEAKSELIARNIFSRVENSFKSYASRHCVYNLNSQESAPRQRYLYEKLKEEIIPKLGLLSDDPAHYYNKMVFDNIHAIMQYDMDGFLRFRIARLKTNVGNQKEKVKELKETVREQKEKAEEQKEKIKALKRLSADDQKKYKESEEKRKRIENSRSYKIGRALTSIPRRLRKLIGR